jgi:L-asparaginase II
LQGAVPLVEIWRGDMIESLHLGHVAVCDAAGDVVEAWGDPGQVIYPRSACKMIQALPLLESGAADAAGLGSEQLALSCASHNGAAIHTERVARWLADLSLDEDDLRCGPQMPEDPEARERYICSHTAPGQMCNNCSGKHAGFLTLNRHLGGGPDYVEPDHPVQRAVRAAFEDVTGEDSPRYAVDGCSAPNFATSVHGLARAMARFAAAEEGTSRGRAMIRLRSAMTLHPELVAGEGRSCTRLMRAMSGRAAVKTGAEGVFVAMIPERRMGVALKIADGATRASECAIAAILVRLGVLDADDPAAKAYLDAPILNRRGLDTGSVRAVAALR